ncbi:hypothetical protein GCM10012285_36640 [Streptomyces kronopolitis]|uniref:Uncharacterized protein n=1 Tax=Streptomyces kronopolitis TaxID=1612435 RepID=A0ABQ2JPH8_9ACTN|nr:hypothetical protein [Streptomyces kronopolitis]GGN48997.1 hypothetical protein GCM10012285_36640 [Streptomyces kronopolitis]
MFRPPRVSADVPSPRAPLPLSLIAMAGPVRGRVADCGSAARLLSEVSEAVAGAQG